MSDLMLASEKATVEHVSSLRRWSETLFSFRTTRAPNFKFRPGQFARLGLSNGEEILWRAYSIVSAPNDAELEYYAVVVPEGAFSRLLERIEPGMPILTEKTNHGFMTADRFTEPANDLWMLATGTGLGPFMSIVQDADVWHKYKNLILVHGVRHATDLAYQDVLHKLQHSAPIPSATRLHLIQSTTGENASSDPNHLHSRITTLLHTGDLERQVGISITETDSHIMMCGNPAMIDETRNILRARGLRPCRRALPGHFLTENYW